MQPKKKPSNWSSVSRRHHFGGAERQSEDIGCPKTAPNQEQPVL